MSERKGIEKHFGPELFRAIVELIVEEFNRNREWHNEPQVTHQTIVNQLKQKFDQFTAELPPEGMP